MTQKNHGIFITFEGGEGSGKTTLIENLYTHFSSQKIPVVKTREPGGTSLGSCIRELLLYDWKGNVEEKAELFLFLADRSQHIHTVVLPQLKEEKVVLCDRFNDSTLAYQGAARAIGVDFLVSLCNFATSNLKPDMTFLLDVDPLVGLKRSRISQGKQDREDRIEKEKLAFHTKVRKAFLSLAEKEPNRFCILDATHSIDQVFETTLHAIYKKFPLK